MNFSFKLIAALCILFGSVSCQKKMQSVSISYKQPYCGGARPTPEILADAEKVKPYQNKMFIVVSDKGKADSAKTDAKGIMKIKLAPGNYKVYESWRYYKSNSSGEPMQQFDKTCLEEEWKKHAIELTVTKSKLTQKSEGPIILSCFGRESCRTNQILPE